MSIPGIPEVEFVWRGHRGNSVLQFPRDEEEEEEEEWEEGGGGK